MRDIRSDLKDRAALIENEINSAQQDFDHQLQQLKNEREGRIEGLRMELAAINKLMEAEYRRISTTPEPAAPEYRRVPEAEDSAPQEDYRRVSAAPEAAPGYRRSHNAEEGAPPAEYRRASAPEPAPGYRRGHGPEEVAPQAEYRRRSAAQVAEPAPIAAPPAPLPLADFLVRRVNEAGPLSKDDLRQLAVRAGYFQDAESATRSVHATLLGIVKGGRVRELPNGALAPASMIDTLRQRRAV